MAERFDADVFVAGGGPAGLAAAIAARQAGLTVTLADSARPPIDKACGEGIMPEGVAALRRLGITLPPPEPTSFAPGQFSALAGHEVHRFEWRNRCPLPARRRLWRASNRASPIAGRSGCRSRGRVALGNSRYLHPNGKQGVVVDGHTLRCRWLIGADGQNSRLRAQAGLEPLRPARRRFGFRCHYGMAPWSEFVEVHWSDRGQMYITPVGSDQICVALITAEPHLSFDEALPHFSAVAERLRGARRLARMLRRGHVTVGCHWSAGSTWR